MEKTGHRLVLRLIAGLACAGAAVPAHAQMLAPASAAGLTKAEAILGGAPSRLAAILASQASGGASASAFAATYSPGYRQSSPGLFPLYRRVPVVVAPASPDRPDVFNSVAMPISASSLDRRWDRVSSGAVSGGAARYALALRGHGERVRIAAVNSYVNARVAFVPDSRQFGVADRWSAPSDTLSRGRGDCEDYALAKMALLRSAGFADKDLYLVILKDVVRRADHAVLVVRSEGRFLVLDNGTDRLLDSADVQDYRPILTFTAGQKFTHGYRRSPVTAPVTYASTAVGVPTVALSVSTAGMPSTPYPSR